MPLVRRSVGVLGLKSGPGAVLEGIDSLGDVDAIYYLGDLVGYAPWPNE